MEFRTTLPSFIILAIQISTITSHDPALVQRPMA